jgi:hypothetical protein
MTAAQFLGRFSLCRLMVTPPKGHLARPGGHPDRG